MAACLPIHTSEHRASKYIDAQTHTQREMYAYLAGVIHCCERRRIFVCARVRLRGKRRRKPGELMPPPRPLPRGGATNSFAASGFASGGRLTVLIK